MPSVLWGWTTDTEASSYFAKRLSSIAYTGAVAADQEAAMMTAFYRLIDCNLYGLATITPPTDPLRRAQCEMAIYLLLHLSAEDHRIGIQAQGVIEAGIVKEKYRQGPDVPIPPIVDSILVGAGFTSSFPAIKMASIGRDDDLNLSDKIREYSEDEI
jgi:hypothetical protein